MPRVHSALENGDRRAADRGGRRRAPVSYQLAPRTHPGGDLHRDRDAAEAGDPRARRRRPRRRRRDPAGRSRPIICSEPAVSAMRCPVCLASRRRRRSARSAFGEAIALLERALPHLTDPLERARLICRIGQDHWLNGESAAAPAVPRRGHRRRSTSSASRLDAARAVSSSGAACGRARSRRGHAPSTYGRAMCSRPRGPRRACHGPHAPRRPRRVRARLPGLPRALRRAVEIAEQAGPTSSASGRSASLARAARLRRAREGLRGDGRVLRGGCREGLLDHRREHDLQRRLDPYAHARGRPRGTGRSGSRRCRDIAGEPGEQGDPEQLRAPRSGRPRRGARCAPSARWSSTRSSATGRWSGAAESSSPEVLAELGRDAEAADVLPATSTRTELQDIVYDAAAQIRLRLGRGADRGGARLAREIAVRPRASPPTARSCAGGGGADHRGGPDGAEALVDAMSLQGNEPGDELRGRAARPACSCPRRGSRRRSRCSPTP